MGTVAVGDFKAEALIFDVGDDPPVGFGCAAELGLPVAVEDDPVDVAFEGIGLPAVGFAGGEVDVDAGACAVVRFEEGFDGAARLVDDGGRVVSLFFAGKPPALVEDQITLHGSDRPRLSASGIWE